MVEVFTLKTKVFIDYGQKTTGFVDNALIDAEGKVIKFKSTVDALNYISKFGWKIQNMFIDKSGQECYLFYKDIIDTNINKDFKTKSDN